MTSNIPTRNRRNRPSFNQRTSEFTLIFGGVCVVYQIAQHRGVLSLTRRLFHHFFQCLKKCLSNDVCVFKRCMKSSIRPSYLYLSCVVVCFDICLTIHNQTHSYQRTCLSLWFNFFNSLTRFLSFLSLSFDFFVFFKFFLAFCTCCSSFESD